MHNLETPVNQTEIVHDQFAMFMTMVNTGMTTIAKAMEKLGIRDILFDANSSIGGDATPANKVLPAHTNNTNNKYENDNSFRNQPINIWGKSGALPRNEKKFITETVKYSDNRPCPV